MNNGNLVDLRDILPPADLDLFKANAALAGNTPSQHLRIMLFPGAPHQPAARKRGTPRPKLTPARATA